MRSLLIAAAAVAAIAPAAAYAEEAVEIGSLTCRQTDRTNLVIFSEAKYSCVFDPTSGANERYEGSISKIGVDLSSKKVETMVWFVFAPADSAAPGALEGTYVGASADASVGAGVGVRGLVGGFERSFTLQPAAVSGVEGIGLAAGIEQFDLEYQK